MGCDANCGGGEVLSIKSEGEEEVDIAKILHPGYRFCPTDEVLIDFYLKGKISNQWLPKDRVFDVKLYQFNPEELSGKYKKEDEKECYFFTPRDRKYKNGSRPNRAAGDGYWKATGADKHVRDSKTNKLVGYRKALVFYRGKPPKGNKTNWIMHEFRVSEPQPPSRKSANDMTLDDWVLCRIYEKVDKGGGGGCGGGGNRNRFRNEELVAVQAEAEPDIADYSDFSYIENYSNYFADYQPNVSYECLTNPPPLLIDNQPPQLAQDDVSYECLTYPPPPPLLIDNQPPQIDGDFGPGSRLPAYPNTIFKTL